MNNLIVTLLGGVFLIAITFLLMYRLSQMSGKMVAVVMAFAVTGVYVPVSIFVWPGADVFAIHIALYLVSVYILGIITSQRDARKLSGQSGFGFHWAPAAIVTFFCTSDYCRFFFYNVCNKRYGYKICKMVIT